MKQFVRSDSPQLGLFMPGVHQDTIKSVENLTRIVDSLGIAVESRGKARYKHLSKRDKSHFERFARVKVSLVRRSG